jgi:hypothetical protein
MSTIKSKYRYRTNAGEWLQGVGLVLLLLFPSIASAQFAFSPATGEITGYSGPGGAVVIPGTINNQTVTGIADQAFINNLTITSVTIPGTISSIGFQAFADCTNLTSVTISGGVETLAYEAFLNTALTSVQIPASVNSIDFAVFDAQTMNSVTVDPQNPFYSSSADGILFDKNQSTVVFYPPGKPSTTYTIPNTVTTVAQWAFADCTHLSRVTIPNSVTTIDQAAFANSYNLTSVTIPDGVTGIAYSTFAGCTELASVSLPNTVTAISQSAFNGCSSLNHITIPPNVTDIGNEAFGSCTALTSVTIPASVTNIEILAFGEDTNLTTALFLGNAPATEAAIFGGDASNFSVGYVVGATGFTSPTWTDSAGDSYPAFAISNFTDWEGFYGIAGTPFKDGVPNLLKYLYDVDPTISMTASDRAALPVLGKTTLGGTEYLTLTYRHSVLATGVTVKVQTSSNLQTWTTLTQVQNPPTTTASFSQRQVGTDGSDPVLEIDVLYTGANQFIRLGVAQP